MLLGIISRNESQVRSARVAVLVQPIGVDEQRCSVIWFGQQRREKPGLLVHVALTSARPR